MPLPRRESPWARTLDKGAGCDADEERCPWWGGGKEEVDAEDLSDEALLLPCG